VIVISAVAKSGPAARFNRFMLYVVVVGDAIFITAYLAVQFIDQAVY
jgi:hypothetical protein